MKKVIIIIGLLLGFLIGVIAESYCQSTRPTTIKGQFKSYDYGTDTAVVYKIVNTDGLGEAGFIAVVGNDTMYLLLSNDSIRLFGTKPMNVLRTIDSTGNFITPYDTTSLSNRINLKADSTDNATRTWVTNQGYLLTELDPVYAGDSANIMWFSDTIPMSSRIALLEALNLLNDSNYIHSTEADTIYGTLSLPYFDFTTDPAISSKGYNFNLWDKDGSDIATFSSPLSSGYSWIRGATRLDTIVVIDGTDADTALLYCDSVKFIIDSDNPIKFLNDSAYSPTTGFKWSTIPTPTEVAAKADTANVGLLATYNEWSKRNLFSTGINLGANQKILFGGNAYSYIEESSSANMVISASTSVIFRIAGSTYGDISASGFSSSSDIAMTGTGNRTLYVKASTNLLAGYGLNLHAGNITAGGTADLDGGYMTVGAGTSKGTGKGYTSIKGLGRQATTSTTANALTDVLYIPSQNNLVDNVAKALFEVVVTNDDGGGGEIHYTIFATDGDTTDSRKGVVTYSYADVDGTTLINIGEDTGRPQSNPDAVTDMTVTWSAVDGASKITISVTADIQFAGATSFKIKYWVSDEANANITQL
ncbi:MAG: hypothetical protein WCT77_00325 [Bacteroidota bacterium]